MKAEDKAKELLNKFARIPFSMNFVDSEIGDSKGKQCALIAVNEIIKTICYCYPSKNEKMSFVEYWQEVKQEIEKL